MLYAETATSSLASPRATILNVSSGNGRCSAFASSSCLPSEVSRPAASGAKATTGAEAGGRRSELNLFSHI
jgi:hypothetical protein